MRHLLILTCVLLYSISLFAQQKNLSFDGEYQIGPGFNMAISTVGQDLFVQATNKPKEKLTKISETLFKIESIDGTIDFSLKAKRNVAVVKMYGQTIHAPSLPLNTSKETWKEIKLSKNALKGLDGEYQLAPNAKFSISIEDGALFAQMTGQPKFEVYPFAENKFFYKVAEAALEFVKNESGKVKYMLLYQNGAIMQVDKIIDDIKK